MTPRTGRLAKTRRLELRPRHPVRRLSRLFQKHWGLPRSATLHLHHPHLGDPTRDPTSSSSWAPGPTTSATAHYLWRIVRVGGRSLGRRDVALPDVPVVNRVRRLRYDETRPATATGPPGGVIRLLGVFWTGRRSRSAWRPGRSWRFVLFHGWSHTSPSSRSLGLCSFDSRSTRRWCETETQNVYLTRNRKRGNWIRMGSCSASTMTSYHSGVTCLRTWPFLPAAGGAAHSQARSGLRGRWQRPWGGIGSSAAPRAKQRRHRPAGPSATAASGGRPARAAGRPRVDAD